MFTGILNNVKINCTFGGWCLPLSLSAASGVPPPLLDWNTPGNFAAQKVSALKVSLLTSFNVFAPSLVRFKKFSISLKKKADSTISPGDSYRWFDLLLRWVTGMGHNIERAVLRCQKSVTRSFINPFFLAHASSTYNSLANCTVFVKYSWNSDGCKKNVVLDGSRLSGGNVAEALPL